MSFENAEPILALLVATAAFVGYRYGAPLAVQRALAAGWSQAASIHLMRGVGALAMGVLPAAVGLAVLARTPGELGMGAPSLRPAALFVGGAALAVVPSLAAGMRNPRRWAIYPQIRAPLWTPRLLAQSTASWAAYLLAYELCFRGFLLFALERWVGPWPAVAITTALYVLAHIHKDAGECLACFPMGALFAWGALWTGSMWPCFALHMVIAVCSEVFAIRANPGLRFVTSGAAASSGS